MLSRAAIRTLRTREQMNIVRPCQGCERMCYWNRSLGPKKMLAPLVQSQPVSRNPHNYILVCTKQYLDWKNNNQSNIVLTREGRGFYARTALYLNKIENHDFTPYMEELFLWNRVFRPTEYERKRNRTLYEATGYWNPFVENISFSTGRKSPINQGSHI